LRLLIQSPHLPNPQKTTLHGKNSASPAVNGSRPPPSLASLSSFSFGIVKFRKLHLPLLSFRASVSLSLHSGLPAAAALSPLATACASPYGKQKNHSTAFR